MAYQPKSYRKFLAGTISAAVVASAIAPVAGAESKFSDLSSVTDQETLTAIAALVDLGVIQGYQDGTFAPNQTINRGQASEMIVKALKLEAKAAVGGVFEDLTAKSYYSTFAEALVAAKLIPAGGKFAAGTGMTREAMATVLVNALGLTDNGTAVEIKDLDKAAEANRANIKILAQHGITVAPNGEFNPTDSVKRSQFALFFYRALNVAVSAAEVVEVKSVNSTTLEVKVKGELKEVKASDFAFDGGLTVTAAEIVPAAAEETYTTVKLTTSAQEAGKAYKLTSFLGKEVKSEVTVAGFSTSVSSLTAVGAKKLEVKFNGAIDTTKAQITVKKGSVSTNVEKVTFSEDKTSAVIETVTKLTEGEYTVSVAGLTTEALSSSVKVATEKVAKIEVPTTTAPMNSGTVTPVPGTTFAAGQSALVNYKVLNQYGEAMTNQSITWTQSTGGYVVDDAVNGKLTITNTTTPTNFVPGTKVYLTGVHAASGTVVNVEFVVGLESKADQVAFKGVYNTVSKKLVDLPAGFNNDGRYVLLFEAKDQYGNKLSLANHNDLVFTSSNPLFVGSTFSAATDVEVDGVTYEAVTLTNGTAPAKGGEVTIQAISKVTGKTATYTIKADALAAVKTFSISAPTKLVAEGEKVEIPFTAADQYGNAVTAYDDLAGNVSFASGLAFEKQNDGTAKLYYTAPSNAGATANADAPVYLTSLVSNGGNFSSLMINVKDQAQPAAVIGLKDTVSTSVAIGNKVEFTASKLLVQDQYGRTLSDTKLNAWLNTSGNAIVVTSVKPASGTDASAFTVQLDNGSVGSDLETNTITSSTDKLVVSAKSGSNLDSTERLVFALSTDNGTTTNAASSKSVTFTKVAQSAYASYEVADLGTMYQNTVDTSSVSTDHAKTVKVYGVTQSGTKVLLPVGDYSVALDSNKVSYSSGVISEVANGFAASDFLDAAGNYKDVKVQVLVTVNDANGAAAAILEKELVVSNKAPKVETVTFNTDLVTDGKANITAGAITTSELNGYFDEVLDQYGVDRSENPTITITNLTKVTGSALAVTANGTSGTSISGAEMGDKFTATYKYASGKTVSVAFTVGLDSSGPVATVTTGTPSGLVLTFNEALYNGTTAIADGANVTTLFTAADVSGTSTAISITSATYDATAKTVTFVIAGAEATDTITVANTVKDAAGNTVSSSTDVAVLGATAWTVQ
ncbi:S-layer homology domain-containing protein [Neobacillus sp. D3-1R]|uniref:S-layer homology domain-containing protein n=1 Tax=Neobacillus sp. D3-1R TaxID=3445778 RepID=UPI003FA02119